MATLVVDRPPRKRTQAGQATIERNARTSATKRARRPLPATRAEADALYRPGARIACATIERLYRMNKLGLLGLRDAPGPQITNAEAHQAILDALYPEG